MFLAILVGVVVVIIGGTYALRRAGRRFVLEEGRARRAESDRIKSIINRGMNGDLETIKDIAANQREYANYEDDLRARLLIRIADSLPGLTKEVENFGSTQFESASSLAVIVDDLVNSRNFGDVTGEVLDRIYPRQMTELRTAMCAMLDRERNAAWQTVISGGDGSIEAYLELVRLSKYNRTAGRSRRFWYWAGASDLVARDYPDDFDRVVAKNVPRAYDGIYLENITLNRAAELIAGARESNTDDAYYLLIRCSVNAKLAEAVTVTTMAELYAIVQKDKTYQDLLPNVSSLI